MSAATPPSTKISFGHVKAILGNPEEYLLHVAAVSGLVLAALHLMGLLDWLADRIPGITLILVASLGIGLISRLSSLQAETRTLERSLRAEVHESRQALQQQTQDLHQEVEGLKDAFREDTLGRVRKLQEHSDPVLLKVLGHYVEDLVCNLDLAVRESRIELEDVSLFPGFYANTLRAFPGQTFLATSYPYKRYFWANQDMIEAINSFTEAHGKMKRVFFYYHEEELDDAEVREVLNLQRTIGVEVFLLNATVLRSDGLGALVKLLAVESQCRIGWEAIPDGDKVITRVTATTNERIVSKYKQTVEQVFNHPATRPFEG